ncbi:hypothetical protein ABFX02_06G032500 [Erythranthe guttata]
MSRNYDNWERIVAAVLKKEQLWQLFHEQSRSPSISSESSSGFSFSFCLNSSLDDNDVPFSFTSSPRWSDSNQNEEDGEKAASTSSSILVKDHKNVTSTPSRKRDLKIQVPKQDNFHQGGFKTTRESLVFRPSTTSPRSKSPIHSSRVHPRVGGGPTESHRNWSDDAKHQSHPLPLPPGANSNSPPFSRPNSGAASPSTPLLSPDRTENLKSTSSHWKKGKLIGKGPLGDVFLGFNSEKGEMCAMKEVALFFGDAKSRARMLEKEIAVLSTLKHPNIVQYYGAETVGDNLCIYFEYVSGGSIYTILQEYGRLGESAIRSYAQQILLGLAYLHSKRIAHSDIKGASVLVDPNGRVKLSNFGIGKHMAGQYIPSLLMDSPYWMAPEVIMNPNVRNPAADIWSLGCTVLEMALSKPPISHYNEVVAMFKIANHKELPTIPDHLSDEGKDFVRQCLQWDPQLPATASRLLEHPFVKSSSPLGKQLLLSSTSSYHPAVTNGVKSEGTDYARNQLDPGNLAVHSSGASKSNFQLSDIYAPRNISTPISPVGSPLPHPRSSHHMSTPVSPVGSPLPHPRSSHQMSTPVSPAGTPLPHPRSSHQMSTPVSPAGSPLPHPRSSHQMSLLPKSSSYHHLNLSVLPNESFNNPPKHSPNPPYWDPNILRGVRSGHDLASSDKDSLRNQLGRTAANERLYEHSVLADRVFQQLHRTASSLYTSHHHTAGV